jgi:hypothetical protein
MTTSTPPTAWGVALFVATGGYAWIARSITFDGVYYHLHNARIVRRWGTTSGLNELIDGPTKETVLDAMAPVVTVTREAAISIIPCRAEKWATV